MMLQKAAVRTTGNVLILLGSLLGVATLLNLPTQRNTASAPYAVNMAAQPVQRPLRREMMAGIFGGAALAAGKTAFAVTPVDIKDDRKANEKGFNIIYEARDLDLPQNVRDGFTQARASLVDTKARVVESQKRFPAQVLPAIKAAYWSEASQALRLQVGTLRFDLQTLADAKADKKVALAARKTFLQDVEQLDLAIQKKKSDNAVKAYEKATASLDKVLKAVV